MAEPARVLVAEDDATIREIIVNVLTAEGFLVDAVEDGVKAMRSLEQEDRYSLVILDMMMPRADGPAVLSFMDERRLPVPVIVMSGGGPAVLASARHDRVKGRLAKPFDPADLLAAAVQLTRG